jgi:hypothetical protein
MKNPPQACVNSRLAFGQLASSAKSETGRYISQVSKHVHEQFQLSVSLGLRSSGVFDALCSVFEESNTPGWDGDSAEPISHETYLNAYRFLEALPPGIQIPSVGVEPDGHMTLEWHKGPRQTISISVSPDGFLYFSALMGLRKTNGSEPFFGDVPKIILDLIGKVYAE